MNIERPGSPSATTVAPTSKRRSTSIETKRSRLASERPPKKGVAIKNAFRSGELIAIDLIYSRSQRRQAGRARRCFSGCCGVVLADYPPRGEAAGPSNPWRCGWRRAASSDRDAPILSEGCSPAHRGQDVPPCYRVDCVASRRVLPRERFSPLTQLGPRCIGDARVQ